MRTLLTAVLFVSSTLAFAAPTVKTWVNPECANGDCELKAMRLYIDKWNSVKDQMAGNQMSVEIETTRREDLKKYAIVQYIRGCLVMVSNLGEQRMAVREFFGKQGQPFLHKTWELDSASDKDPIYWSNPDAGYDELRGFDVPRNSFYANDNPLTNEGYGTWAGKLKNLKMSKIFASDFPTTSYWQSSNGIITARTSSLEFRTCLHKIEDVPATVEDPKTNISAPIICMDWASNYQFDFTKKTWSERTSLHPACK